MLAVKKGDVDNDGDVDRTDSDLVTLYLRGKTPLTDAQKLAADVASPCDGTPNRADARTIHLMAYGRAVAACTSATSLTAVLTSLHLTSISATMGVGSVRFAFAGSAIEAARVLVYDLSGNTVYDSGLTNPNALRWNLLSGDRARVPNGVYLYVVTAKGFNGQVIRSEVKKLVVLR